MKKGFLLKETQKAKPSQTKVLANKKNNLVLNIGKHLKSITKHYANEQASLITLIMVYTILSNLDNNNTNLSCNDEYTQNKSNMFNAFAMFIGMNIINNLLETLFPEKNQKLKNILNKHQWENTFNNHLSQIFEDKTNQITLKQNCLKDKTLPIDLQFIQLLFKYLHGHISNKQADKEVKTIVEKVHESISNRDWKYLDVFKLDDTINMSNNLIQQYLNRTLPMTDFFNFLAKYPGLEFSTLFRNVLFIHTFSFEDPTERLLEHVKTINKECKNYTLSKPIESKAELIQYCFLWSTLNEYSNHITTILNDYFEDFSNEYLAKEYIQGKNKDCKTNIINNGKYINTIDETYKNLKFFIQLSKKLDPFGSYLYCFVNGYKNNTYSFEKFENLYLKNQTNVNGTLSLLRSWHMFSSYIIHNNIIRVDNRLLPIDIMIDSLKDNNILNTLFQFHGFTNAILMYIKFNVEYVFKSNKVVELIAQLKDIALQPLFKHSMRTYLTHINKRNSNKLDYRFNEYKKLFTSNYLNYQYKEKENINIIFKELEDYFFPKTNTKNSINKEYEKILATTEDLKPTIDLTLEKSSNQFTLEDSSITPKKTKMKTKKNTLKKFKCDSLIPSREELAHMNQLVQELEKYDKKKEQKKSLSAHPIKKTAQPPIQRKSYSTITLENHTLLFLTKKFKQHDYCLKADYLENFSRWDCAKFQSKKLVIHNKEFQLYRYAKTKACDLRFLAIHLQDKTILMITAFFHKDYNTIANNLPLSDIETIIKEHKK